MSTQRINSKPEQDAHADNHEEPTDNTLYPQLNEITGDLITMAADGSFDLIAHGCNCFHTMGAGLALALAKRFPEIRAADQQTIYADRTKLGTYSLAQVFTRAPGKLLTILNCYTQYYYGWIKTAKPLCSYPATQQVMTIINHEFKGQHLGLPRIGGGLARGKWSIIKAIIGRSTPDLKVTIFHYCK